MSTFKHGWKSNIIACQRLYFYFILLYYFNPRCLKLLSLKVYERWLIADKIGEWEISTLFHGTECVARITPSNYIQGLLMVFKRNTEIVQRSLKSNIWKSVQLLSYSKWLSMSAIQYMMNAGLYLYIPIPRAAAPNLLCTRDWFRGELFPWSWLHLMDETSLVCSVQFLAWRRSVWVKQTRGWGPLDLEQSPLLSWLN